MMYNKTHLFWETGVYSMKFKIDAFLGSNISLVFESLDVPEISRDTVRSNFNQAALMDTGDVLVILHPSGIVTQFGDKRILVSDQSQSKVGDKDLWTFTWAAVQSIKHHNLIAYGFNYDLGILVEEIGAIQPYFTAQFLPQSAQLVEKLESTDLTLIPRMLYNRGSIRYDIRMEPVEMSKMVVHLNAHFAGQPLPDAETLKQSFISQLEEVNRFLDAI
jgi:hypothetical protein